MAEIDFEGSGVRLYGYQTEEGGAADIYIDGELAERSVQWEVEGPIETQQLVFEKTGLDAESHTLKIVLRSQREEESVNVDYILVQGPGTPAVKQPIPRPAGGTRLDPGVQPLSRENVAYPASSVVVNITRPPYNAKGDGVTDDTKAIQRALHDTMGGHKILYVPNGTYLISETLEWSKQNAQGEEAWGFNHIQGQNRDKTIFRLKDDTFTDPDKPRAIMWCGGFGSADWFHNYVQDMTFDSGIGNPGAIGLQFFSNNTGAVRRLKIVSRDGMGAVGLDLDADMNGPLLAKNILVDGFSQGIRCGHSVNSQTFEHITLRNQRECAFVNNGQNVSVRSLRVEGETVAIRHAGGLMALLDAVLVGKGAAAEGPAIRANSFFYARDLATSGYGTAIEGRDGAPDAVGPEVDEYMSNAPTEAFDVPDTSLRLPIEETPDVPWDDPDTWAVVDTEEAGENLAQKLQAAIDSGATTVFIASRGGARLNSPVTIRGKVRRFLGCGPAPEHNNENMISYVIAEGEAPIVVFEQFENLHGVRVAVDTNRTVVFRSTIARLAVTRVEKLFLEDFGSANLHINPGQHVWARQLNIENQGPHLTNNGGMLWLLGYKTERGGTLLDTRGGGWSELFGNFSYTTTAGKLAPMFANLNSNVFAFFNEVCYSDDPYAVLVREVRGDETKKIHRNEKHTAPYIGYHYELAPH